MAYQKELNENFKIKYVGNDVLEELDLTYDKITYEQWADLRRREKLKDRAINRTEMNIKLPPANSKFPQNIHSLDNSQAKWIKDKDGTWIINKLPIDTIHMQIKPLTYKQALLKPQRLPGIQQPLGIQRSPGIQQPLGIQRPPGIKSNAYKYLKYKAKYLELKKQLNI